MTGGWRSSCRPGMSGWSPTRTRPGSLIPLGIKPVGVFGGGPLDQSPQLEGLDIRGITPVGIAYGEVNFEAVASLEPDVIVTLFDPKQTGPVFGFTGNGEELAGQIAPIIAIDGGTSADAAPTIARFVELAEALGASPTSAEIAAQRSRFEAAIVELKGAVTANPGVKVVAFGAYAGDLIYFARPDMFASLRLFREAGVELVVPEGEPGDANTDFVKFFWDAVSFELADKYPADLILLGNNEGTMSAAEARADPAFATVPAVVAGRLVTWRTIDAYSYDRFAQDIEALAAGIRQADPNLVR